MCFSTAVPELENGIADFDKKSLIMHPSQSPASLRQRPEQRSTSRSLSRSTASNSTPASLSVTRLEDVPVSPANKKLGKALRVCVLSDVRAGCWWPSSHCLFCSVSDRHSAEAYRTLILMQANMLLIIWPVTCTLLLLFPMHSRNLDSSLDVVPGAANPYV